MALPNMSPDIAILSPPLEGIWRVVDSPGHDTFAFDLAATDLDSRSTLATSRLVHIFGRAKVQDSYSWGKPVRSPIYGTILDVQDGSQDRKSLNLVRDVAAMLFSRPSLAPRDIRPYAGNYVIIETQGVYVLIAHMRMGSIRVQKGDQIRTVEVVGEVGNSGFTLEPHLHIQLFDQVDNYLAARALPFKIDGFEVWKEGVWQPPTTDILPKGEIVRFLKK